MAFFDFIDVVFERAVWHVLAIYRHIQFFLYVINKYRLISFEHD